MIGDDVKLLCTVSADCCRLSPPVWEKGFATPLLVDGASINSAKYVEDYDGGATGFNLIICTFFMIRLNPVAPPS
jgi:hypothetical protein